MWFLITIGVLVVVLVAVLGVQQLRHGRARSANPPADRDQQVLQHRMDMRAKERVPRRPGPPRDTPNRGDGGRS